MKYTGEKCFHCAVEFSDSDDVVVCPECGTPYHRECYKESGTCTNHALHESGGSWKSEAAVKDEKPQTELHRVCTACMHSNPIDAEKCEACGTEFSKLNTIDGENPDIGGMFGGIDPTKQYLGYNPDEDFEGAKLKEVAQFVDSNTFYYLPLFKRMKDLGSKVSFNFICLFFPYFYFANRKMWLWGVIAAVVSMLFSVPEYIYILGSQGEGLPFLQSAVNIVTENEAFIKTLMEICQTFDWGMRILLCLFSNWLYMRFAVRSINKVKAHYGGPVSPGRLKAMGGVNPANILIMGLILFGLAFAVNFVIVFIFMMI